MADAKDADAFVPFDGFLARHPLSSPWRNDAFVPNLDLLVEVASLSVEQGWVKKQASGRFAKGIDAWVAHNIRAAGFDPDAIWPRATPPRVLTDELAKLPGLVTKRLADPVRDAIAKARSVAPVNATVLGRVYVKQVDVCMAHWSRGPELVVSTKSMLSSYGNNLRNRFEETYGDGANLRGRFPLLSLGFLYAVRSDIPPDDLVFLIDMLQKLAQGNEAYDTTCLLVFEWEDDVAGVRLRDDLVPQASLGPAQFFETLIDAVLVRTPVAMHVEARNRRLGTVLPITEGEFVLTDDDQDPSED